MQKRKEEFYPLYEKHLLNQYLELKGNIRVFVRLRPILPQDFKAYSGTDQSFELLQKAISILNQSQISIEDEKKAQTFNFDSVFGQGST